MTVEEVRSLILSAAAIGPVSIFVGDLDEVACDAWEGDQRVAVFVAFDDESSRRTTVVARFATWREADNFVAAVAAGTPETVKVI